MNGENKIEAKQHSEILLKSMKLRIIFISFLFLFFINVDLLGHAHVWIHYGIIIHFDKKGIAGFNQEWVFDEMFSNMIIHDFDKNENGIFESKEVKDIYNGAFINLKKFEYFTHVKIDNKKFKVKSIKDFNAKIVKNRIVYHFFVPCHITATSAYKELKISIYDESFYTNIELIKDLISFERDKGFEYEYRVEINTEESFYFGQVHPEAIILRFRKQK